MSAGTQHFTYQTMAGLWWVGGGDVVDGRVCGYHTSSHLTGNIHMVHIWVHHCSLTPTDGITSFHLQNNNILYMIANCCKYSPYIYTVTLTLIHATATESYNMLNRI